LFVVVAVVVVGRGGRVRNGQVHADRGVHDYVSEVEHGSRGHSDEVAAAVVVDGFDEALELVGGGKVRRGWDRRRG